MTAMTLHAYRHLMQTNPVQARAVWDQGLPVAVTALDCQTAIACLERADFANHRFTVLEAMTTPVPQVCLPEALVAGIEMAPGWVGNSSVCPTDHPLHQIGAAMILVGLAAARGPNPLLRGEVRRDPEAGLMFQRSPD